MYSALTSERRSSVYLPLCYHPIGGSLYKHRCYNCPIPKEGMTLEVFLFLSVHTKRLHFPWSPCPTERGCGWMQQDRCLFALHSNHINPMLWGFQWAQMAEEGGSPLATPNFVAFVPSCGAEMCRDTKGHEVRCEEIKRRNSISQNLGSMLSLHN